MPVVKSKKITGGRPAPEAGVDWRRQQVRLIQERGAGAVMRSGKTPVADRRL